jgi:hypothetical protein
MQRQLWQAILPSWLVNVLVDGTTAEMVDPKTIG